MTLLELLLARKLVVTEIEARGVILAGKVLVNDVPVTRVNTAVKADDVLRLRDIKRFVSRAGYKLDAALKAFKIPVDGRSFLDIGAATGGFTDALLQRGANFVATIDVGRGLLHQKLRTHAKVQVFESCDFKIFSSESLRQSVEAFVADISFASLETILLRAFALLRPAQRAAEAVVLFKPQFEIAKKERSMLTGGILNNREKESELITAFAAKVEKMGLKIVQSQPAAIKGRRGNQEYLLHILAGKTLLNE